MGFLFPMTGVTFPFTYIPNLLITAKAFPLRKSCRPWSLYGAICVSGHPNRSIRQPPCSGFFAGMPAGIAPRIMKNGVKLMVFCKVLIIKEIKDLGWLL